MKKIRWGPAEYQKRTVPRVVRGIVTLNYTEKSVGKKENTMKNRTPKKRLHILAALLTLAMLLPCVAVASFAETPAAPSQDRTPNLDDSLLIHYDFEGTDPLADKAGDVKTNLSLTVANPTFNDADADGNMSLASSCIQTYDQWGSFTFADGTVISKQPTLAKVGLVTGITADTKEIMKPQTSGTWFARVKLAPATNGQNGQNILGFRRAKSDAGLRPMALYYNIAADSIWGAKDGFGLSLNNQWPIHQSAAINIAADRWVELAVIRTWTGEQYHYSLTYFDTTASKWTEIISLNTTHHNSSDEVVLSLFAEFNAAGSDPDSRMQPASGYDDVRYYTTALTTADLTEVRNEVLKVNVETPATDPVIFRGAQRSKNVTNTEGNTYSIRLIAEIRVEDIKADTYAGFKVANNGGETKGLAASKYYTKLLAQDPADATVMKEVTPSEGYALIAIIIDNIPADAAQRTFTVTAYTRNGANETLARTANVVMEGELIKAVTWVA